MSADKPYCKFVISDHESHDNGLCHASDKFCSIIENTIDAIITFDLEGKITGWNASAEEFYQYPAEEILGRLHPIIPEERIPEFFRIIERMKKNQRIPDLETQCQRKDGKLLDVGVSFFPIRNRLGQITEFCAMHRDITEKKRLQSEMMHSRELATIGQLAAGIAHALNTPLASILMSIQMVKEDIPNESTKEDIERIERQTERCKNIVRNLLNLSRPSGNSREPADLNKIIQSVIRTIEPTLKDKIITIVTELDTDLPEFTCDPQSIEELFINLIGNAGDAIQSVGTITIRTRLENEFIHIEIKDTGKGIQPDHLKNIFDPFFTTKEIGKGTGLGLALCSRIIHEHQGKIAVDSQLGSGSSFKIRFPIQSADIKIPVSG